MRYEVKFDYNKECGYIDVDEFDDFCNAWDEFIYQINDIEPDSQYAKVILIDNEKGCRYYFEKDETIPYPDSGTLYYQPDSANYNTNIVYMDNNPDMQVKSWTENGKHFLEISGSYGQTCFEFETTEEIDTAYLMTCDLKKFMYKNNDLHNYIVKND